MQQASELEQLKSMTVVVADTGDIDAIAQLKPTEATTNPSLILKAATGGKYTHILEAARSVNESAEARIDRVLTGFGAAILEHIPGRVSTEVDARLSFDTNATIAKARRIIGLYEAMGISRERILIKIAATWQGCEAARVLEAEGIHCNMTLIFCTAQAEAAAQASATLISPFVGRIYDWFKAAEGACWDEAANSGLKDPGVQSVTAIYKRLKAAGSKTQIMGASFRNKGEILALAGCDLLTISPKLLNELDSSFSQVLPTLTTEELEQSAPISISEPDFLLALAMSAVASEKLAAGIRSFAVDTENCRHTLSNMMSTFSNPPGKTQVHTVLIVEPDSYWRKVHSMDVSRDGTFEVLCAVRNKRQAVAFLSRLPVDFIVTNSMLPDGNPADIIRFAQKRNPDCLVLAASDCEDANIVMQTITSGANGYVLFSDKTTNLCSCLRVLQAGGSPASPAVASTVLRSLQSRENQRQQMPEKHPLTARELDTLRLLAEGISFSQISHILVISKSTVSTHAANIYRKLDVHSRTEAVYRAKQMKLL